MNPSPFLASCCVAQTMRRGPLAHLVWRARPIAMNIIRRKSPPCVPLIVEMAVYARDEVSEYMTDAFSLGIEMLSDLRHPDVRRVLAAWLFALLSVAIEPA